MTVDTLFHVFEKDSVFYLYLTDYKQLFCLNENDFLLLRNNKYSNKHIVDRYVKLTNNIDRKFAQEKTNERDYGLFLCVANTCNAMCSYCFAGKGDYGKAEGLMTSEVARSAVDFYLKRIPVDAIASLIFFGGEPLIAYDVIVDTCEYIFIKYGQNKKINFFLVTNGTLLTKEMIDYFASKYFTITISIDGNKNIHNSQRPLKNGEDSFFEATKNLSYLLGKMPGHARGTYINYDYSLPNIYQDLLNLGFSSIDLPPDILNFKEKIEMKKFLDQLDALYEFVLKYVAKYDDFPFSAFKLRLRNMFLPKVTAAYMCGAGKNVIAVDYKGDVYPCHRFSSITKAIMGNILDKNTDFHHRPKDKPNCHKCWNKYSCSHGCAYDDLSGSGVLGISSFWCIYSKKMTELVLAICTNLEEGILQKILGV